MRMRLSLASLALTLGLAQPLAAETAPSDCADLVVSLQAIAGYSLTAPPAANAE